MGTRESENLTEDRELVEAAQAGSLSAYDELMRRYRGGVLFVAGQILQSRETAEDVAQEVFVAAFQHLGQLQDASRFAPWLYTLTRNRARRVAVQNHRMQTMEGIELENQTAPQSRQGERNPLEETIRAERDRAIRCFLAELPPSLQIVLRLYYYEGWNVARIAAFTSLSPTTVKWRLHTGRKRLAKTLLEADQESG